MKDDPNPAVRNLFHRLYRFLSIFEMVSALKNSGQQPTFHSHSLSPSSTIHTTLFLLELITSSKKRKMRGKERGHQKVIQKGGEL